MSIAWWLLERRNDLAPPFAEIPRLAATGRLVHRRDRGPGVAMTARNNAAVSSVPIYDSNRLMGFMVVRSGGQFVAIRPDGENLGQFNKENAVIAALIGACATNRNAG